MRNFKQHRSLKKVEKKKLGIGEKQGWHMGPGG